MKLLHPSKRTPFLAAAAGLLALFASNAQAGETISGKASEGLVFAVPGDDGLDLWRARLSDGALQKLLVTPKIEERWPIWSDKAGRLAYISRPTEGLITSSIMLLDPLTGAESDLGPKPDFVQRSHVWSPDGKYVAHTFRMPASGPKQQASAGTALVDLEKKTRELVSEVEEIGYRMIHLNYSHDGTSIVAHGRNPKNSVNDKMWLLRPGAKPKQLGKIPRGVYGRPHFTRDDKKIVFNYQQTRDRNRDLLMLELGPGKRAQRVSSQPRNDDHSADMSPTRDEMVFVSDRLGSPNLFLVNLQTGKPKILTKDPGVAATNPVWSPDGNAVAYVSIPKDQFRVTEKEKEDHTIRVVDRTGKLLFEAKGTMPNFMPPWTGDQPVAAHAIAPTETTASGD
ncbi:MAG: hypothetical protein GY733_02815 [bacterium]|nr:hypothetical protein [bacterium]